MPRQPDLIPAEFRDAAAAHLAAEVAMRRAFRERIEKEHRCTDAVRGFEHATAALWSASPNNARSSLRAVQRTLLDVSRALAEAGRLETWEQIDHERTYEGFCCRNHRVMSLPSYNWAKVLLGKACEGELPMAVLTQTWKTESLRDAIHWLRIFIFGLSGEDAVLPKVQDRVPPPQPAPSGPTTGGNAQQVAPDFAVVAQRPASRLSFDAETWTIMLDGKDHRIADPKTFQIYKVVAEAGRPITKSEIQDKVKGVRGKKAIPKRLQGLPPPLRTTIRTNTTGCWLALPASKKKGTTGT
jgi:hypothetical protein